MDEKERKKLEAKLYQLLLELLNTERAYVEDLVKVSLGTVRGLGHCGGFRCGRITLLSWPQCRQVRRREIMLGGRGGPRVRSALRSPPTSAGGKSRSCEPPGVLRWSRVSSLRQPPSMLRLQLCLD